MTATPVTMAVVTFANPSFH
ncbi:hypothetical protein Goari_025526 [Gossypium aridum]|uniref:Uncharacterized protein n=2 Tax=Gossypium TaxID=3633 RepID=A0A7J8X9E7_GOSAI|nr:hypothetical protein [Gossypium aridum]